MEQRIITLFHESIEAKMQAGEYLAPLLCEASEMLVHCLVNEGRILVAGNGISAANAQILSASLCNRFERERPGLPAMTLGMDVTTQTAIACDISFNEIYARQVRALGHPGDVLVLISTTGNPNNLVQAVAAAHERDMNVIALAGPDGGNMASVLDAHDLELRVPVYDTVRLHEIHLLSIFCLCDLVDQQLFGGEEC
ncbi:SIS domain-containing protein [Pseudomaricurvus sp. HS19]|uniref:SIS domain-containing protein n=1 Tax=Pseudomaricurvus sp. HS19 TaxID=2692626 RepID=UPI001370C263|nr:SIS domain-containing protein [Pseudomaricurvus sp. HS19]MYM64674.1 SIS domain-containing protein [Pseudomaricurvus sp. HS19]